MMTTSERLDPVQAEYRRRRRRRCLAALVGLYFLSLWVYWGLIAEVPKDFASQADHFKYGSIGADTVGGIPYWIWQVLPELFPDHLPDPRSFLAISKEKRRGIDGYQQFGFIVEEGHDLPIGFSQRRVIVDRVGLNCAVCHTGTVRIRNKEDAERISTLPTRFAERSPSDSSSDGMNRAIVLGMPAHTLDLEKYFLFLFACANDARFTTDNIMSHIAAKTKLGLKDKIAYRFAVPQLRETLLARREQLAFLQKPVCEVPDFGPGRVDTFNPYKCVNFAFPYDGSIGTSDFPSLWNQRPREGMHLHWDGNNQSVFERNISASIGAGVTPTSLDLPRMLRVAKWTGSPEPNPDQVYTDDLRRAARSQPIPKPDELPIPKYPFAIDAAKARAGKSLYEKHCYECHDWNGKRIGEVMPLVAIGTDPERHKSFTLDLVSNQNTLGAGHWWRFRNFRRTSGYSNMPLDGLWVRAPYLHNGSVPTLWDLLKKPDARPKKFFRGNDQYDAVNVGFVSHQEAVSEVGQLNSSDNRSLFLFDTSQRGNSNSGHDYATDLSDSDKWDLIEYLKKL